MTCGCLPTPRHGLELGEFSKSTLFDLVTRFRLLLLLFVWALFTQQPPVTDKIQRAMKETQSTMSGDDSNDNIVPIKLI
ncbi:hypothetical protein OUZ56_007610 [Daphnia magna]|uniref:Uncharacterized protein n=1 Tax=Daphnia magna TaxID=35525 RepID=A0ABR0AAF9_9CRUS|nr:hypothetical protein OUZ56_007610 [Daphnia magna]